MRKIIINEEVKIKIQELLSLGYTPKRISENLNIAYPTISSYLRNKGIKFRPDKGNIHYFENIDSYAKAYILGFIAADGAIVGNTLTITVKYEDRAVLEFIKSEIGNSHQLLEIKRPSSFDNSKEIHHIRYYISDTTLNSDIMKYGINRNKSLTMENIIVNIPYKYRDAFIIGYFDGDGSVSIKNKTRINDRGYKCRDYSLYINIRGTQKFLEGICEHLNISKTFIRTHDSIPSLNFANKKDAYRLFQCYSNLPFYYIRKYNKFLERINHPSYDKYKQVQTISSPII